MDRIFYILKRIKVLHPVIFPGKGYHSVNIRLYEQKPVHPDWVLDRGLMPLEMMEYLGSAVRNGQRILITGGTRTLWSKTRVRIVGQFVGGAFGCKEDIAGQIHANLLAHITGRPVKLLFDRHESTLVHPKWHFTQIRVKIGSNQPED